MAFSDNKEYLVDVKMIQELVSNISNEEFNDIIEEKLILVNLPPKKNLKSGEDKASKQQHKKQKLQQHASKKKILTIITRYKPPLKNNIHEIIMYDILFKLS
ncbi:hypothetical protein C1646_771101 [Rhizophagus diaphanus]|nr:hypothetical protein C1646_771101 [Rhizophagus diaphanus] [Rhizophagus sp. MUCL 43196]